MKVLKENMYEIEKNIEKILTGRSTGFLMPNISKEIQNRLGKKKANVYIPFKEAEKIILYGDTLPKVKCYKIECSNELKHSSILGSLFGLNISAETFGDIAFWDGNFYFFVLDEISELVWKDLKLIGKDAVNLVMVPVDTLDDYQREYEKLEFVVSSLRIDGFLGKIVGCNRKKSQEIILEKEVFVNYEVLERIHYIMKINDVFSIKGYGKYVFKGIIGNTKKDNYIVSVWKYV